jgi:Fe-S-cluster containining protein
MFGMFLKLDFICKVDELAKRLKPASLIGKTECQKCGHCCWKRPCNVEQDELENIAKYLSISVPELIQKYLVVDDMGKGLTMVPVRHSQKEHAGQFLPARNTWDIDEPCIFHNKQTKQCTIHRVKPKVAAKTACWLTQDVTPKFFTRQQLESLGFNLTNMDNMNKGD